MSSLNTPLLDSLFKEIEQARNIAAMLPDYQNANIALTGHNEKLKEDMAYLTDKAETVFEENSKLKSQIAGFKNQIFELGIERANLESELEVCKERRAEAEKARTDLQNANTNLHQVILNLETETKVLKNEISDLKRAAS